MDTVNVTRDRFKQLDKLTVTSFRLGLGPFFTGWLKTIGHVMVLTTVGRKAGRQRRTPVNYAIVRGDVYCAAGLGQEADWYHNIIANPNVEVWIGARRWSGRAEPVANPQEWLPVYRQILINSGRSAQAAQGLDPLSASDEALLKRGAGAPVARIRLERLVRGPGGPGDLIWVWPVSLALLLLAAWRLKSLTP